MKWTSEKPTKPGWYWYRRGPALGWCVVTVDHLITWANRCLVDTPQLVVIDFAVPLDEMGGQWAGPLEEPQE